MGGERSRDSKLAQGHPFSRRPLRSCRNPLFTRISETLRPRHSQPLVVQIQIHQCKAGAQPMMVLFNSSVSHLFEAKDALQNPERVFYLRSDSGLHPVLGLLYLIDKVLVSHSSAGHILRLRSRPPYSFSLPLILKSGAFAALKV